MNGDIKNFRGTVMSCDAEVSDWADLNRMVHNEEKHFEYMGNYMDDDSDSVWAMFSDADSFRKFYVVEVN